MDCETWSLDEYLTRFQQKIIQQKIPITGSVDLTHRCNLRCLHCYIRDDRANHADELDASRWKSLIDEFTSFGCLYLLITGGEALIRKDFADIYAHARASGLIVTIFTNGTLINQDIIELFKDLPPHGVEITLYGATEQTYEKITGIHGAYGKLLKRIDMLLDNQIDVKLKTVVMTHNHHEYDEMENMAKQRGLKFRLDGAIFPRFDGDRTPLNLRIAPEEIVQMEFSNAERFKTWRNFYNRMKDVPKSDKLYICGAGLTNFHIDPYGVLKPCMMVNSVAYPLKPGRFIDGWHDITNRMTMKKCSQKNFCNRCEKQVLCEFCPGFFDVENGSEETPSMYLCEIGHYRFQRIRN
jgi:MoaA/NifB/PqqE/SkfB family radical SAM enzyme